MSDNINFETPFAETTGFTYLSRPDEYKGKRKYKVSLILDPMVDEDAEFLNLLETAANDAYNKGVEEAQSKGGKAIAAAKRVQLHLPYEPEYSDDGEETGRFIVKAAANADYVRDGVTKEINLRFSDAEGNTPERTPIIYTGTILSLNGVLVPYFSAGFNKAGVSLRIYGVKIDTLVDRDGAQPNWSAV